jgi:DNA-binding NarL/FixJ family response regulator
MTIRLFLVDDHRMFREALRIPLEEEEDLQVVGQAGSGGEALRLLEEIKADVVLLDIALPDLNGIEVARTLRRRWPALQLVALSGYADRLFVDEMLKAGARAYVLKSAGAGDLITAIRTVREGGLFLSPEASEQALRNLGEPQRDPPRSVLGRREAEILRLIAQGRRSSEIAARLGITVGTVSVHRSNLKRKLGLRTTAELTRYAIREGLLSA